jgi:hypothetical protein
LGSTSMGAVVGPSMRAWVCTWPLVTPLASPFAVPLARAPAALGTPPPSPPSPPTPPARGRGESASARARLRGKTRLSDLSDSGVVTEWSTDDRCDDGVGRSSGDFEVVGRSLAA